MARPVTDHDAMRRRLVDHGRELVASGGPAQLVLAEVARRAGLSTPSLYHYVDNRRGLVLAVLAAEVEDVLGVWDSVPGAEAPTGERVAAFLDAQARYLEATPAPTVAFILDAVLNRAGDPEVDRIVGPVLGRAEALFRAHAEAQAGDLREPPDVLADLLRASVAGLFLLRALGTGGDATAVARALLARLGSARASLSK